MNVTQQLRYPIERVCLSRTRPILMKLIVAVTLLALCAFNLAWAQFRPGIILGDPPLPPEDATKLPRGVESLTGGTAMTVNTASREQSRIFFNSIYGTSDDIPMDSTADVSTCTPGTNSDAYVTAVQRRINWFRAMAGVPAVITFDHNNSVKNQQAAEMMSANGALSHTPPTTWTCYTTDGATAARNSNIALGSSGPDSIAGYICDPGANNLAAGHRRWLLYPQTRVMGTGDVPSSGNLYEANATWVMDGNYGGTRPATRTPFVAWPPAGYVPAPVVYPRWSCSYPNADFSAATVTMSSNGVVQTVSIESTQSGYGENTIVWRPSALDANNSSAAPFAGTDTLYSISINNVSIGGKATNIAYTVTVFDPSVPGSDYNPTIISGPSQPAVGNANQYSCVAATNATSYLWRIGTRSPGNLVDGAESGLGNFTAVTTQDYSVITNSLKASGSYSFHLAHVSSPYNGYLQLNRLILPATNTILSFKSRLSWSSSDEIAKVQISTSGGAAWQDLYSQAGANGATETAFNSHSISLSNYVSKPVLIRWAYLFNTGSYYPGNANNNIGWFVDDISITNAEQIAGIATNTTASASLAYTPLQTGSYVLQSAGLLFSEYPMEWGPAKLVTAVAGPAASIALDRPVLTNHQAQIGFHLTAGSASQFTVLESTNPAGPWTTNLSAVITTNVPGQSFRFSVPTNNPERLFRVRTP